MSETDPRPGVLSPVDESAQGTLYSAKGKAGACGMWHGPATRGCPGLGATVLLEGRVRQGGPLSGNDVSGESQRLSRSWTVTERVRAFPTEEQCLWRGHPRGGLACIQHAGSVIIQSIIIYQLKISN